MSGVNVDLLTEIRSLLMLWAPLTDIVSDRIRPHQFHSEDGTQPAIRLELLDGTQKNVLDRSGCIIDATIEITCRAPLKSQAEDIAEIVRSKNTNPSTGLDGYSGSAGVGQLMSAERLSFSNDKELDDGGDETDQFVSVQVYQILFQLGG